MVGQTDRQMDVCMYGWMDRQLALSQLIPILFPKIHAEEISGNNGYVELSFCAKKLDDKVRSDVFSFP